MNKTKWKHYKEITIGSKIPFGSHPVTISRKMSWILQLLTSLKGVEGSSCCYDEAAQIPAFSSLPNTLGWEFFFSFLLFLSFVLALPHLCPPPPMPLTGVVSRNVDHFIPIRFTNQDQWFTDKTMICIIWYIMFEWLLCACLSTGCLRFNIKQFNYRYLYSLFETRD